MKTFNIKDLVLESKEQISNIDLVYQTFGELNHEKSNIIWVFHAISGDSNVLSWWSELFGKSKLHDPSEHFIICVNCIGSPYGSSRPKDASFPQFTIRDFVKTYLQLAKHLEINSIHTVIGLSLIHI